MSYEDGDTLIPLGDPLDAQSRIWVRNEYGRLTYSRVLTSNDETGSSFKTLSGPPTGPVFLRPRQGESAEQFAYLQQLAGKLLNEATNGVMRWATLKEAMLRHSRYSADFVEGCLRAMASDVTLVVSSATTKKTAFDVRLSPLARERERRRAYGAAFAHELAAQAEQIGRLVGHRGVAGGYREDLLRALIQRHIPQRFHAATGFIDGMPNQLDILIYDQLEYAPLFRAGDLVVVPMEAVRAIIEVKTTLTSDELHGALKHLADARPARWQGPPIFTGVFAYNGATAATLMDAFIEFHRMPDDDMIIDDICECHMIMDIDSAATAICVLQQCLLMPEFASMTEGPAAYQPWITTIESFAKRGSEAGVFFELMSRFLRHPFGGQRIDRGFTDLYSGDRVRGDRRWVYGSDFNWGPYQQGDIELTEPFEQQLEAYVNWLNGAAWVESGASSSDT